LAAAGALVGRAVELQLHESDFLQGHGDARYLRTHEIHADRGMVLDRNGEPLAISTPTHSAWIMPAEFLTERARWGELASTLNISIEQLETLVLPRLERQFVYLRRHLTPDEGAAIRALGLAGVGLQQEYRRYYPAGEVAAHVLGFTNVDDRGQEGVELAFDERLRGQPGLRRVIKDRLGRVVEDVERLRAIRPGEDIALSIDERVQYVAYRALKNAVHAEHARAGSMVIVDPHTGEIIALVNQPAYNPNNRADRNVAHYRNRAVTDLFEPGSTMKPFTVAIALESGRYVPDTIIETAPGHFKVGRNQVRDIRNFGTLDVAGVIEKSSNVGVSKIALSLEAETMWRGLRRFGFGTLTDVALPGETYGRLNDFANWSDIEHATLSFGYGLSVTAVQLARAYSVLANDGWLLPLSIVKRAEPLTRERVLAAETARAVRSMLERVVVAGTAQRAAVPGYTAAGKTGTVHKSVDSGYAEHRYLSLFAGMIPARDPRLVAVIMLDEPQGGEHFGGLVAAPIFATVMREATRILNIPPDALGAQPEPAVWLAGATSPPRAAEPQR
ncbi:MAG: penicillin-binding transpeptidase domain-containing protein, partial [Gammaproteobacteria bacterium]